MIKGYRLQKRFSSGGGGGSKFLKFFFPFLVFFQKILKHQGRGAPPTAPPEYATEMLTIEFKIFINIY